MQKKNTLNMSQVIASFSFKHNGDFKKIMKSISDKEEPDIKAYEEGTAKLKEQGIEAITLLDDDYPNKLRMMNCPPFVIYIKGNRKLLNEDIISITGTPYPDKEGITNAEKAIEDMKGSSRVLALSKEVGIEEKLDEKAIEAGIPRVYFSSDYDRNIVPASDELYVTERPFNETETVKEKVATARYRSGMSNAVCIVESEVKNEIMDLSYVMLGFALDQSKDTYAYPTSMASKKQGNNLMIQNGMPVSINFEKSIDGIEEEMGLEEAMDDIKSM